MRHCILFFQFVLYDFELYIFVLEAFWPNETQKHNFLL